MNRRRLTCTLAAVAVVVFLAALNRLFELRFAAGDIVRGASLVVWAIRDGRDAAEQMHSYIQQKTAALAVAAE